MKPPTSNPSQLIRSSHIQKPNIGKVDIWFLEPPLLIPLCLHMTYVYYCLLNRTLLVCTTFAVDDPLQFVLIFSGDAKLETLGCWILGAGPPHQGGPPAWRRSIKVGKPRCRHFFQSGRFLKTYRTYSESIFIFLIHINVYYLYAYIYIFIYLYVYII